MTFPVAPHNISNSNYHHSIHQWDTAIVKNHLDAICKVSCIPAMHAIDVFGQLNGL